MNQKEVITQVQNELAEIQHYPVHSFGQNFLVDDEIALMISQNVPSDCLSNLLEIGPGLGILTSKLLMRGAMVLAIEKDETLGQYLEKKFGSKYGKQFEIITGDATRILPRILKESEDGLFLTSNLPFNISSRIIGEILDHSHFNADIERTINGAIIMFQEEFVSRLTADHGSKEYGRLSVMFRSKMDHKILAKVPSDRFYPPPRVNASVVKFHPKKKYDHIPENEDLFNKLVNVVFLNRRKKLKNSVNPPSFGLDLEMEDIRWILEDMGIADMRPEDLPPNEFILLSNRLADLE